MKKIVFEGCGTAIATPFTDDGVNFEEFKKLLEEDEIETYKNETIEELNLDFLIDYVYENEIERIFNSLH